MEENKSTKLSNKEIELLVPTLTINDGDKAVVPKWMSKEEEIESLKIVKNFINKIKKDPNNIMLAQEINNLGDEGTREMLPQIELYDRKINVLLKENKEGSLQNKTLLEFKKATDFINPAVIKNQPIKTKMAWLFKKTKLPGSDQILTTIYQRQESVKSTMLGIKKTLWTISEDLKSNLIQLDTIYKGLLSGQHLIERDIYIGKKIYEELTKYLNSIPEGIERQNLMEVLANTTSVINSLQTEENVNLQFFAGSQMVAKLTIQQIDNIKRMTSLLERSILASLGLAVVSAELSNSLNVTENLKEAIGNTLLNTSKEINKAGDKLIKARSKSMIDIEKLEQACNELETLFKKQKDANKEIIEIGHETGKRLTNISSELRKRVENEQGSISEISDNINKRIEEK